MRRAQERSGGCPDNRGPRVCAISQWGYAGRSVERRAEAGEDARSGELRSVLARNVSGIILERDARYHL